MTRTRPSILRFGPLGAAAVLLFGISCKEPEAVKFGAVLPLSGDAAIYGEEIRKGVELAFEDLEAREGAPRMELVVVDSKTDPANAKSQLSGLFDSGVRAAIGGVTTDEAMEMVQVADQRNRVLLSPSASTPDLTGISRNFYRVWPSDNREGQTMGQYAARNLCKNKTAVILAAESSYARGVQAVFKETFESENAGGTVLEKIEYPPRTTDLAPLVERVVTLNPDCVYLADYAESIAAMIRTLKEEGYEGRILTVSAFATADAIASIGEMAEWVFMTHPQFDPGDATNVKVGEFVERYKSKYGETPGIYAAHGYDSMVVLYEAMLKGGDSGSNFWKGMRGIQDLIGVTGPLQFDELGDVQKFPRVYFILESSLQDHQHYLQAEAERLRREYEELKKKRRELLNNKGG